MDLHYQKEVGVGTLVLVGIGLFVAGTMWLKGATFHPTSRTETIRFADIQTLKADNAVTVSGYQVGKVEDIEFRRPGEILVTVSLLPDLKLRADASASISSGFFSSDSRLVINPGSPSAPEFKPGTIIEGAPDRGLMAKGADLADRADSVLLGVQAIANKKTADEITRTLQSLQRVLDKMDRRLPATTDDARKTMAALRKLADHLDSTIATIPVKNAVERADTLARNLSTMSIQLNTTGARLDTLLQKMNAGEGTLGKFVTDSGLYGDSRETLQALKRLIDELNKHPGKVTVQVKMF